MTEIAEIWRERALVDLQDRMHLLLTSYSHQLPVKSKLNNFSQIASEEELAHELEILNLQMSKTEFMYLCQITAIYQQPEMKKVPVDSQMGIKEFRKKFHRTPLLKLHEVQEKKKHQNDVNVSMSRVEEPGEERKEEM